jgi:3-oxoacyl-[acyl-carrier-protein] synthase II
VTAVAIVAYGALSALGTGAAAGSAGDPGEPARVAIARDEHLARAGLSRPFAARVDVGAKDDRATAMLEFALVACLEDLDRVRPGWRAERLGLILGTSSGGMRAAERAFDAIAQGAAVADVEAPTYVGPMARAVRRLERSFDPAVLVLGACASATLAVGLAMRWLDRGSCDVVLAGGFDEITVFVAAGFESLRAVTASPPPRPFRVGRDGMALGEGAAVLALARPGNGPSRAIVTGFGAASDAVHLTAPDRDGGGLSRAAASALDDAGRPKVDLVSAHATATPFNDAAEARAIARALGPDGARDVIVHPFKAQIGHTLGAAGVLELLAMLDAIERGVLPAAAGTGVLDPEAPVRLLDRGTAGTPRTALKLSSAFGGANAALLVGAGAGRAARPARGAFVHQAVRVDREPDVEDLSVTARTPVDRLLRADALVRWALAAVARLEEASGPLTGAGVVVGSALATLETNALFAARIRERGALAAEPRRFPYTSPNAVAGQCSIAFGLTGPSFSVGGGMHAGLEALAAAAILIEGGDADRMVVVCVDDVGPATRAIAGDALAAGAVAVLLDARGSGARARVGAIELRRGAGVDPGAFDGGASGHRALLPLLDRRLPDALRCGSALDVVARVALDAV